MNCRRDRTTLEAVASSRRGSYVFRTGGPDQGPRVLCPPGALPAGGARQTLRLGCSQQASSSRFIGRGGGDDLATDQRGLLERGALCRAFRGEQVQAEGLGPAEDRTGLE